MITHSVFLDGLLKEWRAWKHDDLGIEDIGDSVNGKKVKELRKVQQVVSAAW
jgi:hypothetical protein